MLHRTPWFFGFFFYGFSCRRRDESGARSKT